MDPVTIAALIAGGTGLLSSIGNWISDRKTNNQNLDYAKQTTQQQWERDDTSYQRSVTDAVAAGFSPLAVLDGGLLGNSSAIGYQGQAPQFDINSVLNAVMSAGSQLSTNLENARQSQREIQKINTEYQNNLNFALKELENDKEKISYEMEESLELLKKTNEENLKQEEKLRILRQIDELGVIGTQKYDDPKTASMMYTAWCDEFSDYCEAYKQQTQTKTELDKESLKGGLATTQANLELQTQITQSNTTGMSFSEYMESFFLENPMPLNSDGSIPYYSSTNSTNNRHGK